MLAHIFPVFMEVDCKAAQYIEIASISWYQLEQCLFHKDVQYFLLFNCNNLTFLSTWEYQSLAKDMKTQKINNYCLKCAPEVFSELFTLLFATTVISSYYFFFLLQVNEKCLHMGDIVILHTVIYFKLFLNHATLIDSMFLK